MLDKKEDYRYVSKSSLSRISVASSPYPTRDQKLVTLAVDGAFLRESVQERWDMLTPNSERGKIGTPRVVDRDIDRTIFGTSSVQHDFDGVKWLVKEKGFYDAELLEQDKIGWPSDLPTTYCDRRYKNGVMVDEDYEKDQTAQKKIDDAYDAYEKIRVGLEKDCREESKKLKEELDRKDEAEYDKLVAKKNEEHERWNEEVEKERELHGMEIASIEKENAENERSILERMSKEGDREKRAKLEIEYQKCVVEGKRRLEKCELDYSNESEKNLERHDATLYRIDYEYSEDYRVRHREYGEELAKLEKRRDDGIADAKGSYLDVAYDVCVGRAWRPAYETFPQIRKYESGVTKANVSKSTAEKFYSRTTTFDMAETPLNRIFADLEHMTAFSQLNVYNDGLGRLHVRPVALRDDMLYGEWSPFFTPFGDNQTLEMFGLTYPTKFGVYYGGRNCADVITKIYVDLLVCMSVKYSVVTGSTILPYDAEWSKSTQYSAGTILYYKGKIERWSMVTDVLTKQTAWVKLGEDDIEIRFRVDSDFKSGKTIGIYVEVPPPEGQYERGYNIGPCTILQLKEVYSTERDFLSYSMQRVELHREKADTSMVDAIDRCYDRYLNDCAEIGKEYDPKIKELEKNYAKALEAVEEKHIENNEKIDDEYAKKLDAANREFVEKTCGTSASTNEKILKAEGDERSKILSKWEKEVLQPAENELSEKDAQALAEWDADRSAENERYSSEKKAKSRYYSSRIGKLKEEKEEKLAERYQKYEYDSKGAYVLVGGYVKEKRDIIKKFKDDPLEEARNEYSVKVEAAEKEASGKLSESYAKFKSDVDGLGLPMEKYSVPLTVEEQAFLEVYDREHSTNYYTSYITLQERWWNEREAIFEERNEKSAKARKEEWSEMLNVSGSAQDARDLWEGEVKVPEDTSSPPPGEGTANKSDRCYVVASKVWVVSRPRTLTGADFEKYYKELEDE